MSNYKVRSRDLVDLVNEIRSGTLILSPYFQRKLVWRMPHKIDFIKTVLLGFPFPEIFLSRGSLDVGTMKSTSCIVDGQQRMNTLKEYLAGAFPVDGNYYADLDKDTKERFLRYEVAIIDLDLPETDPKIVEIFSRLNRTFYALSTIEKLSSEYGSSEFMLIAKLICGELKDPDLEDEHNIAPNIYKKDPNIGKEFITWANTQEMSAIRDFFLATPVFTKYEVSRQVHLMFALNLMATLMVGAYARNEQVKPHLDLYADSLPDRDLLIERLNKSALRIEKLKLSLAGPWYSKSNSFTLLTSIDLVGDEIHTQKVTAVRKRLVEFMEAIPEDYALAAKEAVNNRRERLLRQNYVVDLLMPS